MNRVASSMVKIALTIAAISLVPRLGTADSKYISSTLDKNYSSKDVVILQPEDPAPDNAVKINSITFGDGKTGDCTYQELMAYANSCAKQSDANIIKITGLKAINKGNIYDHLEATLYKAEDPKAYEREIVWNKDRKLTWDDFKGPIHTDLDLVAAATYCGFGFETNVLNDSNKTLKILVYNSFYRDQSWARNNQKSPEVLEHEQGHFDLCEVYTRVLRQRMSEATGNARELKHKLESIYDDVKTQYRARQEAYEEQTEHGLITDAQHKWESDIALQLKTLDKWSQ